MEESWLPGLFLRIGRAIGSIDTSYGELDEVTDTGASACVRQAPEGGGSRLVSAVAVHDHLAVHHPCQLERLHRPLHRAIVTPDSQSDPDLIEANHVPIFSQAADGPTLRYRRHWIEKGHARLGRPLTRADLEALNTLDATFNDPAFRHDFPMAAGDLLFIDNHKLAHARSADRDDPRAPRLMVRLRLDAAGPANPACPLDGGRADPG